MWIQISDMMVQISSGPIRIPYHDTILLVVLYHHIASLVIQRQDSGVLFASCLSADYVSATHQFN